jgi:hypothetical protein
VEVVVAKEFGDRILPLLTGGMVGLSVGMISFFSLSCLVMISSKPNCLFMFARH